MNETEREQAKSTLAAKKNDLLRQMAQHYRTDDLGNQVWKGTQREWDFYQEQLRQIAEHQSAYTRA
ncbi:MAG: hypothetical protein M0Z28_19180 [Rhodospirillales bacterium]|nr:hypothetical protein [Rhodospirillales bacterium]